MTEYVHVGDDVVVDGTDACIHLMYANILNEKIFSRCSFKLIYGMYYYRLNNYITEFHINLSEFII